MLNTICDAAEVEGVGAFNSEYGLIIPRFHTPKVNSTCSLQLQQKIEKVASYSENIIISQ